MKDYTVTLRDTTGKTCVVHIGGDAIVYQMEHGASESDAVEGIEQNAFANAIQRGEIGEDCWVESYNR